MSSQGKRKPQSGCTSCLTAWLGLPFPASNSIRNYCYVYSEEEHRRNEGRLERSLCYWTEIRGSQCGLTALTQLRQRNRETDTESMGEGGTHTPILPSSLQRQLETTTGTPVLRSWFLNVILQEPLILKKVASSRAGTGKYRMSLVVRESKKIAVSVS